MNNLFGEEIKKDTKFSAKKRMWSIKFKNYLLKEYIDKSESTGRFCCGYEWCCDECKDNNGEGVKPCRDTIMRLAKELNVKIDYDSLDFEKFESEVKSAYDNR